MWYYSQYSISDKTPISTQDQEKIAVIYGTSELHAAGDRNSFTQELHKVLWKREKYPFFRLKGKLTKYAKLLKFVNLAKLTRAGRTKKYSGSAAKMIFLRLEATGSFTSGPIQSLLNLSATTPTLKVILMIMMRWDKDFYFQTWWPSIRKTVQFMRIWGKK